MGKTKQLSTIDRFKVNLAKHSKSIWDQKAGYLITEEKAWFDKALLYIAGNDFLLKSMTDKTGQLGVLKCLINACSMGLEFGGMYPQAYILPFKGVPTLIPTAVGLRSIALSDPPIIMDIQYSLVYTNEKCIIDIAGGTVDHVFNPIKYDGNKGEPVGGYVVVTDLNAKTTVLFMGKNDINKIRDLSPSYRKKPDDCPWTHFWDDMALKTIIKKALKPFIPLKDSRSRAIEEQERPFTVDGVSLEEYQNLPVEDRVLKQMNGNEKEQEQVDKEEKSPPPGDKPRQEGLF